MNTASVWSQTAELPSFAPLAGDRKTDVLVIGGGIAGILCTYRLRQAGVDPADAVMVGDREHDVIGAHMAGLDVIGVLYGYGSREELTAAGADQIAETPEALETLILSTN